MATSHGLRLDHIAIDVNGSNSRSRENRGGDRSAESTAAVDPHFMAVGPRANLVDPAEQLVDGNSPLAGKTCSVAL